MYYKRKTAQSRRPSYRRRRTVRSRRILKKRTTMRRNRKYNRRGRSTRRTKTPSRLALALSTGVPMHALFTGSHVCYGVAGRVARTFFLDFNTNYDALALLRRASLLQQPTIGGANISAGQVHQMSLHAEVMFNNQDHAAVYLKVYRCTPRADVAVTEGDAAAILTDGWADIVSTGDNNIIGQTVYQNHRFTSRFKVKQVAGFKLDPGVTAKRMFTYKKRFTWNRDKISNIDILYHRNRTQTFFVEAFGAPTNDADFLSVSTASPRVNIIATKRYRYTWVVNNQHDFYTENNLTSTINESVMERDGDITTGDIHA